MMQNDNTTSLRTRLPRSSAKAPLQLRSMETEKKILSGARRILQNDGAMALSARKIAKECGLTTGAIYNLFSGMPDILYRLYEEQLQQEIETVEKSFGQDDGKCSVDELLQRFVELDRQMNWGSRFDIELLDAVNRNPDLSELLAQKNSILRKPISHSINVRNPNLSASQANALAAYVVSLMHTSYDLRHRSNIGEKALLYDITLGLMKSVICQKVQSIVGATDQPE